MNEQNFDPSKNIVKVEGNNEIIKEEKEELNKNNEQKNTEVESFSDFGYENKRQIGKQMFLTLNSISKEDAENYRKQNEIAWEQASKKLSLFLNLKNSSDEQLKGEYYEILTGQNSPQYTGGALVSLDSLASRRGFYEGLNGKNQQEDNQASETIEFLNRLKKLEII